MTQIAIDDIVISDDQREINPQQAKKIQAKMKARGYNTSYPITIDENNVLVDGGHRIEAAKLNGLTELPFILKPDGVSRIKHAIVCNDDGADTREYDVFDYAELCYKYDGKGKELAVELVWSIELVSKYKQIKDKLHPLTWELARDCTKNKNSVQQENKTLVQSDCTKVQWRETHFRALIAALPCTDNISYRFQLKLIRAAIDRFIKDDPRKRVTAKWIENEAIRYGWYAELAKYMRDHLVEEVPLQDRKNLLRQIYANAFGEKPDDESREKFQRAISTINEQVLGVKLYQDDAFQRIPLLSDNITLVVTDPPYNITDHEWDNIGDDNQYMEWLVKCLEALRPKLAEAYHLFICISPHYQAQVETDVLRANNWPIQSRIIWSHRNLSEGRGIANKFASTWEMVFHCGTHSLNWPTDWNDERFDVQVYASPQSNFKGDNKKQHETQKPIELFELFVKLGSKPGDIVIDPFAGSGTTGVACKNIGQRQCMLIEVSDKHCETIEQRLNIKRIKETS